MNIRFIKKPTKILLGSLISPIKDKTIIVNSYGRSGSTMLTKSIMLSSLIENNKKKYITSLKNNLLKKSILLNAWNINTTNIRSGFIYKTHDYPPQTKLKDNSRVIYIFSDPIDVVISLLKRYELKGEDWKIRHLKHLKKSYIDFYQIIDNDLLHLENHFDAWLKEERFPVAFVKYDNIWDQKENISEFLGFKIDLPSYKERKAKQYYHTDIMNRLECTYYSLRQKVYSYESFFTNQITEKKQNKNEKLY